MSAGTTAQLVTDALVMAIGRRGKPNALLHHSNRGASEKGVRHNESVERQRQC